MADMCHKMESGTAIPEDNVTLCIYHYTLYHLPNRISKRHVETLIPWVAKENFCKELLSLYT